MRMRLCFKTILSACVVALLTTACDRSYDDTQDGDADFFSRSKTFVEEIDGQLYYFIPVSDGSNQVVVT